MNFELMTMPTTGSEVRGHQSTFLDAVNGAECKVMTIQCPSLQPDSRLLNHKCEHGSVSRRKVHTLHVFEDNPQRSSQREHRWRTSVRENHADKAKLLSLLLIYYLMQDCVRFDLIKRAGFCVVKSTEWTHCMKGLKSLRACVVSDSSVSGLLPQAMICGGSQWNLRVQIQAGK